MEGPDAQLACSKQGGAGRSAAAAAALTLPTELIQYIFLQYEDVLCVKDRLRAQAVCKAWRGALAGLPVRELALGLEPCTTASMAQWVLRTRPSVGRLMVWCGREPALCALAIHSVDRQALRRLIVYERRDPLPLPDLFPHLEVLVHDVAAPPAWLGGLRRLERLREAILIVGTAEGAESGDEAGAVVFPGLAGLTLLLLQLGLGVDTLVLPLSGFLALRELSLSRDVLCPVHARADLAAGGAAPQLVSLHLLVPQVAADFGLLPALRSLLVAALQLEGTASIGGATAQTRLSLAALAYGESRLSQPYFPQLLRSAPPSLLGLELKGRWTPELAAAVADMSQVRGLAFQASFEDIREAWELAPLPWGRLWQGLEVLVWGPQGKWVPHLPQALLRAPRVWKVHAPVRCFGDLHTLCRLPSLRSLTLVFSGSISVPFLFLVDDLEEGAAAGGGEGGAPNNAERVAWHTLAVACRALPDLEELEWVDDDTAIVPGGLLDELLGNRVPTSDWALASEPEYGGGSGDGIGVD